MAICDMYIYIYICQHMVTYIYIYIYIWPSLFLRDMENMNSVTWEVFETGSRDRPRDRVRDTGSMLQVIFDSMTLDAALAHPL